MMMEDGSKKNPKATLIKQSKAETPVDVKESSGVEKRRVVVVKKKKRVVVKKATGSVKTISSDVGKQEASSTQGQEETQKTISKPKGKVTSSKVDKEKGQDPVLKVSTPSSLTFPKGLPSEKKDDGASTSSSERVRSGKDTVASPPPRMGNRGVQVLDTKRVGGRAGVVAGRRVDGGSNKPSHSGYGRRGAGSGTFQKRTPGSRFGNTGKPGGFQNRSGGGRPGAAKPGLDRNRAGGGPNRGTPGVRRSPDGRSSAGSGGFSSPLTPPPASRSKKFYKAKKTYENHKKQQEKIYQQVKKKKQVAPANPVPKSIDIMEVITVAALARKMNLRASELITKLMGMGMMVSINQQIDAETASILASEFDCKVNIVSLYDETIIESDEDHKDNLESRPPIVTVMGHVDHGKTKLLDAIRNADVIAGEHGGITQHIGAYMVHTEKGAITFLDTPGHSDFTKMRARGAQVTDLVVLIVAADDGVKSQTIEAIQHAKAAKAPIIVAINKMDLPTAQPDRVKQQLSEYELMPEDWGGSTQFVEISALEENGIDTLLDTLILEADMLELRANWNCRAEGKVIESKVDQGRGIVSTVLVEKGTLEVGNAFVAGIFHGKVRAMFDDNGNPIQKATPAMPVEILGFSGSPHAGDPFQVTVNEREARQFGTKRQELKKIETAKNVKKVTIDNFYESMQDGNVQELKIIIKGDVHGSVEALQSALERLSTNEIRLLCIRAAAGAILEDDVNLAIASEAIIIGFHVRPTPNALSLARQEGVEIRKYSVIFEAVEDIKASMEGMLSPELNEIVIGQVEVRETFKVPKIGIIAGCMVSSGHVLRKSKVHVFRDDVEIHTGSLASLKRFKEDVREVKEGYECGIALDKFTDIQVGDVFEVFDMKKTSRKLDNSTKNE